ncbi:hypothetical protein RCL1_003690 [Eukaryota sp. TZLM3-RCL]
MNDSETSTESETDYHQDDSHASDDEYDPFSLPPLKRPCIESSSFTPDVSSFAIASVKTSDADAVIDHEVIEIIPQQVVDVNNTSTTVNETVQKDIK